MKKILPLSVLFALSVSLFIATLGNGLVTGEVLAEKPGPACKSFENRNNPIKQDIFGEFSEHCQLKGSLGCVYSAPTEELALPLRESLATC